jgi:hypothetical protein
MDETKDESRWSRRTKRIIIYKIILNKKNLIITITYY